MDVADLARDLVAIPSHEDESAAGDYVEEWLREHTDSVVFRDDHGNVFARKGQGIDPDDDPAAVARDGTTVTVTITARDLVALRAGVNTWTTLVDVAERTAGALSAEPVSS